MALQTPFDVSCFASLSTTRQGAFFTACIRKLVEEKRRKAYKRLKQAAQDEQEGLF